MDTQYYYWYSPEEQYFRTLTAFVEECPGLRSVSLSEYAQAKIDEARSRRNGGS